MHQNDIILVHACTFFFMFLTLFYTIKNTLKYQLQVLFGLIIRSRAKKLKNTFNELIQTIWVKLFKEASASISDDQTLFNLIYVQNEPNLSIMQALLFFNGGLINFSIKGIFGLLFLMHSFTLTIIIFYPTIGSG